MLFPEAGFSKEDAVAYYRAIAKVILPHLRNRPLSFRRYPSTVNGDSFWEKDAPSFTPAWVKRVKVPRRSGEAEIEYVVANDAKTLAWIASVGGIEIHPFLHRAPKIDQATDVVFDLDPGTGATILDCCRVAVILRDALEAMELEAFVKLSGSKGLQIYVPLSTPAAHHDTEGFARALAEELARRHPKLIVARMAKTLRARKVFIDWSQNADFKTTVAVYSLRSKSAQPFVSMPVRWTDVERGRNLSFTPEQAVGLVRKAGDLWAGKLTLRQKLPGQRAQRAAVSRDPAGRAATPRDLVRLPKPGSQSGRRLFLLVTGESGNELWLAMHGKFKRWILRPDREGQPRLIAMPAGDFPINEEYYRGEVPRQWRSRVSIEDSGAFEVIEGSYQQRRFLLFFSGSTLSGGWLLQKVADDPRRRSWALEPVP